MNETVVEKEILDAARKAFIQKGKSGARMQDIADDAGVNKALLHYYFRSKEKLFQKVYEDAMKDLGESVYSISLKTSRADELLQIIIDRTFAFQLKNENFLLFFFWEAKTENYAVNDVVKSAVKILGYNPYDVFIPKIKQAMDNKEIKDVEPYELMMNLLSLIIAFFLAFPIIKTSFELSDEKLNEMIESRKKEIFRLIWNDIKVE